MTDAGTTSPGQAGHLRGYRHFLGTGLGSGLLAGICCVGSAIAVGASLGGLSFFTTWMRHYQVYFIIASIAIMAAWLLHQIRASATGRGLAAAALDPQPTAATLPRLAGRGRTPQLGGQLSGGQKRFQLHVPAGMARRVRAPSIRAVQ